MTRSAPHHPADDCAPDATDHMEALGYPSAATGGWDFPGTDDVGDLLDSAIDFIEALLEADMSYAQLPISEEHTRVVELVEAGTWEATLAEFKRRRDVLREADPGPIGNETVIRRPDAEESLE